MEKRTESSKLAAITEQAREEAARALGGLDRVLGEAGIVLPSLGLDSPSWFTGTMLFDLGRTRPDQVVELTALLRDGLNARAQQLP